MSAQSLKHRVLRGSFWSFAGAGSRQLFGLAVFILLSRLLTPQDFGLMAISVAVGEVMSMGVGLGLGAYIVRHADLSNREINTSFWLTVGMGGVASLCMVALAWPMRAAFASVEVATLMQTLAVMPLLVALRVVPQALLQRDFRFKSLALRTMASTTVAGVVSVGLALSGAGVYALVFQRLSSEILVTGLIWYFAGWRPSLVFSWASGKRQLTVGRMIVGPAFLNMATLRLVDMVAGYFLGPAAVGYLRVAAKFNDFIVQLAVEPVIAVALTTFAKIRHDAAALSRAYSRLTQLCALLAFPALMGLAALAPEVARLVFGEQWLPSGLLMQVVCLGSLGAAMTYFFRPLMLAAGHERLYARVALLQFAACLALVPLAAQVNILAVAVAQLAVTLGITLLTLALTARTLKTTLAALTRNLLPPLSVALAMAAAVYLAKAPVEAALPPLPALAALVLLGGVLYPLGLYLMFPRYTRGVVGSVLPTARDALKRQPAPAETPLE